MEAKILKQYKNGNANILLLEDGTRICETKDGSFDFEFPMNMDVKITNKCNVGCPMCHEGSYPLGEHAPLENFKFIDSWQSGCEMAIGGGSVTEYPYIEQLLYMLKGKGIIANITFHQNEILKHIDIIEKWQKEKLIYGIGVSIGDVDNIPSNFNLYINRLDNVVFHVIAGLFTYNELMYIEQQEKHKKVLILGYKHFRRGNELYDKISESIESKIKELEYNINYVMQILEVVSFDNLALEQLKMKSKISPEQWEMFYQGDEGVSNMYIDAVKGEFARNSTSELRYELQDNVKDMFNVIKS